MAQANSKLVKGSGCGTRQWQDDFVLTDTDGVTALFKVAQANGNTTIAGTLAVTGALTASNVTSVTTNLSLSGTLAAAGSLSAASRLALRRTQAALRPLVSRCPLPSLFTTLRLWRLVTIQFYSPRLLAAVLFMSL